MRYSVGCSLPYIVNAPTTMILNVEPMRSEQQTVISEQLTVTPEVENQPHLAVETGSRHRRLQLPPGQYEVRYEGVVETSPMVRDPEGINQVPIRELPLDVLPYLYPSRYCQSDQLGRFAWRQFGDVASGHERVATICNWIYEYVDYQIGSSNSSTSALDTFTMRAGVCRDFAHLGVSLCRALGIPARFVSAYGFKLEPQDFHAVFEAYLGDRWYLFDATRLFPIDGIVRIGIGRDAADTSFATYYGDVEPGMKQVWVRQTDTFTNDEAPWTTNAVSVSRV